MEDGRKQAKIEALNKAFPGMNCGNPRCGDLCAEVYDAAKAMRLEPADAIRKTIERELQCRPADRNRDAEASCRFGFMPEGSALVLSGERKVEFVRFLAEKNKKTCEQCKQYDGLIFVLPEDKNRMPSLPLHPNCRCRYETISISKEDFKRKLGYLSDAAITALEMVYGPTLWGEVAGAILLGTELMTNKGLIIACITNALRNATMTGDLTDEESDWFMRELEKCKSDDNMKRTYRLYNRLMRLLKERGVDISRYRITN